MSVVVFDIETIGVDFTSLDEISKSKLLKSADNEEEEQEIKNSLGLSPLTGEIVTVAMLDVETDQGAVFYQDKNPANAQKAFKEKNVEYVVCTEKEILKYFWQNIRKYQQFVTFNGRGFDCPYLIIRSGIMKIKPTRELMPYRYDTKLHIDLYDQMTFYGAMRRGFSLHMLTQAFGIRSPKEEGIDGAQVQELFAQGRCEDIARYCLRDVEATKQLYLNWEKFIKN